MDSKVIETHKEVLGDAYEHVKQVYNDKGAAEALNVAKEEAGAKANECPYLKGETDAEGHPKK
ncbi:hypothetical protein AKO1_001177 [Acrasis kona]|uniref:Uncharacterized protein n=1 Tax=Acrasis kona TaxID=1008807 RepID=A0AAW2ZBU1_9EUKA